MLEEIIHMLDICIDENSPDRKEADENLQHFKSENPQTFLEYTAFILKSEEAKPNVKRMAMVLATQIFPRKPESGNENLLNYPPELITELLNLSYQEFGSDDIKNSSNAAGLYARIALQDLQSTNQFETISALIQALDNPPSHQGLGAVTRVLDEICTYSQLEDEEVTPMLDAIIKLIKDGDAPYKKSGLETLVVIIQNIDEVLSDQDNTTAILDLLFEIFTIPEYKEDCYDCWQSIATNYYPLLEPYLKDLVPITFADMQSDNTQIVMQSIVFWLIIAQCESNGEENMNIIATVAEELMPLLFSIVACCPFPEVSDIGENEPWTVATEALQTSIYAAPEEIFSALVALASQHMNSSEYGAREASLIAIGSIIEASSSERNPSEIIPDAVNIIAERLTDEAPRVRYNAVLCLHTFLLNILERGDSCAFAALIPQLAPHILTMSETVLGLLEEDQELMSTTVLAAVDFVRFPGFPHVEKSLQLMYNLAINGDVEQSVNAFSALESAITYAPTSVLGSIYDDVVKLLGGLLEANEDAELVEKACHLLGKLFFVLAGQIDDYLETCWNLLSAALEQYDSIGKNLLVPIAALARGTSVELFAPYIGKSVEFIILGLQQDNSEAIANGSMAVSLLTDKYDMTPHLPVIIHQLSEALKMEYVDDIASMYIADCVKDLAKTTKMQEYISQIYPQLIERADGFDSYQDLIQENPKDDDLQDEVETLLISFLQCFKFGISASNPEDAEAIGEAMVDLLEVACGLEVHHELIIAEIIRDIAFLIEKYPDQMMSFMDNEPGFQVCIDFAKEGKIELENVQKIIQFIIQ
ncbi:hypothetical protein TVAG_163310 [Trichomonas vaginalis G3]|uniref:Importin N-terminal domain-containing protein n=1 Tax=Trichomonas vaginalis (strain ATCC PRA-98 / G3) TaxID=412133 RepID=A2DG08_TRIV3|nr:ribosomal protein import into nucleus [Trichomonas vaginalis G3]EAY20635.1 hypothetical protein TVAG_163310 [Trichomonas vaginalis G3]KAI5487350.1 ribosomal protein import into nucleus [Trichomonas vaginalis G3]|eukprot:XP_001581621.1 hypothetical protein [Trichomonas vaginalis G3]